MAESHQSVGLRASGREPVARAARSETARAESMFDDDPFEEFNRAMGAEGDATPYPTFARLRAEAPVHPGVPDLGAVAYDEGSTFTAYVYDAVNTILGDGETFSGGDDRRVGRAFIGERRVLSVARRSGDACVRLHDQDRRFRPYLSPVGQWRGGTWGRTWRGWTRRSRWAPLSR